MREIRTKKNVVARKKTVCFAGKNHGKKLKERECLLIRNINIRPAVSFFRKRECTMMKMAICGVAAVVLIVFPTVAAAELTYTYTGNPFSTAAGSVFTTNDSVTGFVTFNKAPTAGATFNGLDVADFEFKAGSLIIAPSPDYGIIGVTSFEFDGSLNITNWFLAVGDGDIATTNTYISTWKNSNGSATDSAELSPTQFAINSGVPGVWTAVPEPGTITLWSLACLAGLAYSWRRHRKVG